MISKVDYAHRVLSKTAESSGPKSDRCVSDFSWPIIDHFHSRNWIYFSKDQEEIETYVPLLADNTLIALFLLIYVFGLIAIQMPYILVEVRD